MALRTFRRRWISGAASNRCAARHWRGRARSGGSSGEHAMKIIERDVAGASSGEAYQARTRSGGGAQLQEEGQQVYPFADWELSVLESLETSRPDPPWCCSDAESPACAPHPAARAGCPPPVGGGARREKGPQGNGARGPRGFASRGRSAGNNQLHARTFAPRSIAKIETRSPEGGLAG